MYKKRKIDKICRVVGFDQEEEKGDCGNFKVQLRVWWFPGG